MRLNLVRTLNWPSAITRHTAYSNDFLHLILRFATTGRSVISLSALAENRSAFILSSLQDFFSSTYLCIRKILLSCLNRKISCNLISNQKSLCDDKVGMLTHTNPGGRLWQSPGWQLTLHEAWCLIWWFISIGYSMIIHDTGCPYWDQVSFFLNGTTPNLIRINILTFRGPEWASSGSRLQQPTKGWSENLTRILVKKRKK